MSERKANWRYDHEVGFVCQRCGHASKGDGLGGCDNCAEIARLRKIEAAASHLDKVWSLKVSMVGSSALLEDRRVNALVLLRAALDWNSSARALEGVE